MPEFDVIEGMIDGEKTSTRSSAIREFCAAAKIPASVEAEHIPEDVRAYRMHAALRQKLEKRNAR